MTNLELWRGKSPEESGVRPRVAISFWTVSGYWPGNAPLDLDPNAECFSNMQYWRRSLLQRHDRVAIVIVGSSKVWEIESMLDEWADHAF